MTRRAASRLWMCLLTLPALALPCGIARAQPVEDAPLMEDLGEPPPTEGPTPEERPREQVLVAEFGLEERNVVLSAAKTRTTIQEAPAIVTVITREELRSRGFRTVNDVLQTVPGFEGDRWDSNGWTEESFARGNPRGLLILLNGVNIVEPLRNVVSLDRKIPLDAVERIEIVSGPGGVLWGSNALLGVVNIITREAGSLEGFEVSLGGGTGPGELNAGRAAAAWGGRFVDERLKVFTHLSLFTTQGATLEVEDQKVVGALPAPSNDSVSLYVPGSLTTEPGSREYFFNWLGSVRFDDLTLEWMVPFERDHRQLATGGAVLTQDLRADTSAPRFNTETSADDSISVGALRYQSRFAEDTFGINAKAFLVRFRFEENPFGAFAPSDVSPRTSRGVVTQLEGNQNFRYGLILDMDLKLPGDNSLAFGGEVIREQTDGLETQNPITAAQVEGLQGQPERGTVVFEDGQPFFREAIVFPAARTIGAVYVRDEIKASRTLAFSGGARLQASDSYDPALLFSGAAVWNAFGETYLKLNYAEGFRPPNWQATDVNGDAISGLTFQPNPDLTVETSRAGEVELNTVLLKGGRVVRRLYLRADYALTLLDNVIVQQAGRFSNSGQRLIHSVEAFGRLELKGGHEVQLGYFFVDVDDSQTGKLREIANHIVNVGGRAVLIADTWDVSAHLTWIGPREDRNRYVDASRDPFFVDCPTSGERGCVPVYPTDVYYERLEPVWLLRVGTRLLKLYDTVTLSAFGYNVLDQRWADPNLFDDDRILTQSQPKPRWSFFLQAEATF